MILPYNQLQREYVETMEVAMSTAKTVEDIEVLAKSLNADFTFPAKWVDRVNGLDDPQTFIAQTIKVLQAEKEHKFFDPAHYTETLEEHHNLTHRLSCLLSELFLQIFPQSVTMDGHSEYLGDFTEAEITQIANDVDEKGYHVCANLLPKDKLAAIKDNLRERIFSNRVTGRKITGDQAEKNNGKHTGVYWLDKEDELARDKLFQEIAFDPAILAIAQKALGAPPVHVQTYAWWTFPPKAIKEKGMARIEDKNAQRFHQDLEFITFIKVFIYLTDVGEENGPHVYVEGSANNYEEKLVTEKLSERILDADIIKAFGEDKIKHITGPAGQIAFVNTRGYHKGEPPAEGCRLLLQLEYASSLYFNPVVPFDVSKIDAAYEPLKGQAPRIFMNYRNPADIAVRPKPSLKKRVKQALVYMRGRIEEYV
jgi:hypothetical protein